MKEYQKKLIATLAAICLANAVSATTPDKCPSASYIKSSVQWLGVGEYAPNMYSATSTLIFPYWFLMVGNIQAQSEDDARAKLNLAMQTFSGDPDPYFDTKNHRWRCNYNIGYDYQAFAVTLFHKS
ncbi:MAG: hypothetical protein ACYCQI_00830 [Gammaproteobacteria bacterium]